MVSYMITIQIYKGIAPGARHFHEERERSINYDVYI